MHLFLAIQKLPAIPIHPHNRFFPNDQILLKLFVSINSTNIYISSMKFVLNGPILMELWFNLFPMFCSNSLKKMLNMQQPQQEPIMCDTLTANMYELNRTSPFDSRIIDLWVKRSALMSLMVWLISRALGR